MTIIKTRDQWDQNRLSVSPMSKLSSDAQSRFTDSLKFCDDGLCSFYYGDIEKELPHAEYKELMASFGIDVDKGLEPSMLGFRLEKTVNMAELKKRIGDVIIFDFLKDHRCAFQGTCEEDFKFACTSNCYG